MSEESQEQLKTLVEGIVPKATYTVQLEPMDSKALPFLITQPEFMRRMKEMQQTGGGGMFGGNMPEMYNLIVNMNHPFFDGVLAFFEKALDAFLGRIAVFGGPLPPGLSIVFGL